jgi:hypothetical protein
VMVLSRQWWSWRDVAIDTCWRWRCRGDISRGVMSLSSLPGDGVAEVTLAVVRCPCRVMLVMTLLSLADDGAGKETLVMV